MQEAAMLLWVACVVAKILAYILLVTLIYCFGLRLYLEPVKGVCKCKVKLNGKTVLVTGANAGIGLETAKDLAARGARVIIASSNLKKSKNAVEEIVKESGNSNVECRHLDLSKFKSVKEFAREFNEKEERLDILINNAGCIDYSQTITEDGFDNGMQINYLGPFLLTNLLKEKLIKSKPSRIVIVSSCGHIFALNFSPKAISGLNKNFFTRYANSKLCGILWAKALTKRLPEGVTANSLHPGMVKTDILRNMHWILSGFFLKLLDLIFKSAKEGAQTTIHLAVAESLSNISGEYFADCKPCAVFRTARDVTLPDKVWEESMKLTEKFMSD